MESAIQRRITVKLVGHYLLPKGRVFGLSKLFKKSGVAILCWAREERWWKMRNGLRRKREELRVFIRS